jgi:uracil-DNA glycosylase family 4
VTDLVEEGLKRRKHPDAECENCDLLSTGTFVPSKLPEGGKAQYAVIGEAPGFNEAIEGEPFIGQSGQLLNKVLKYHGIERKNLLLTNACLCRPVDNATPSQQAVRSCRPRLLSELERTEPERVLTLGATAADSIMRNTQPITKRRVGNARPSPDGFTVVPTVHPAYCLRNGDAFPYLVRDVEKLRKDMPPWKPPEYFVADSETDALVAIDMIRENAELHIAQGFPNEPKRVLVVDIECGIDKDNDYDHPDRYQMLCIGVAYAKGKVVVFGERVVRGPGSELIIAKLKELFNESLLAGHNLKFDAAGLYPLMRELTIWFDTMLAHYCIDERPGNHALGQLGPEILGTPDWKHEIDKFLGTGKNYDAIPRPELYKYNAYDDAVTYDLLLYFLDELERRSLRPLHDFLVAAANELKFPELNGITIDILRNAELSDEYMQILNDLRVQIDTVVQDPADGMSRKDYDKFGGLNPNSPKQVKEYLHDHGIKVTSTNKDTLEPLSERIPRTSNVGEFLALLLASRYKSKRHGTFIKGIRNRVYRGRVYTSYLLHGTTSGRLASRNPNLQNIVRDNAIRSQFTVSKSGNIFVAGDYKQAEGRVICTLAQDEYLAAIFRDPSRDLFDELGSGLYPGQASFTKEQRVRTKAYFYGLGYGREAFSIAKEYDLPVREVERDLVKFFALMPGVVAWQTEIKQQVLNGNDLVTDFGRHRRFWLITKENRKDVLNEALSFMPQSTASDICLRAFIRLRPRLRGKAFIRLLIHDSITAECKEEDKEYVTEVMREEMLRSAEEWTTYVPFEVDFSYGKNWGELH